jgi:hypothetical protein
MQGAITRQERDRVCDQCEERVGQRVGRVGVDDSSTNRLGRLVVRAPSRIWEVPGSIPGLAFLFSSYRSSQPDRLRQDASCSFHILLLFTASPQGRQAQIHALEGYSRDLRATRKVELKDEFAALLPILDHPNHETFALRKESVDRWNAFLAQRQEARAVLMTSVRGIAKFARPVSLVRAKLVFVGNLYKHLGYNASEVSLLYTLYSSCTLRSKRSCSVPNPDTSRPRLLILKCRSMS